LFSLDPTVGEISYDRAAFDYLAGGQTVTATFSFDAASGSDTLHKSITITVDGANDAPTIIVTDPVAVSEGNTGATDVQTVTVADHVSITDVDASDGHVPYLVHTLAFDSSTGPAPSSGILANLFTLNATDGTISYDRAAFDYLAGGQTVTATFNFDAASGPDTQHKSMTITVNGVNDAPDISLDNIILTPHAHGVTTVSGLSVSDVDDGGSGQFTLATKNVDHGTVAPSGQSGTLSAINATLQTGLTYTPTDNSPIGHGTLTVTDSDGASDAVNFVFRQSGSSLLNLVGNANQTDVLIGGTGADHFVFSANSGHDAVFNFTTGTDKIEFLASTGIDAAELTTLLASAAHPVAGDTLLHLSPTDTLLLKGVATLNTTDFILHV
jgi:VCBS repeat-containing protein